MCACVCVCVCVCVQGAYDRKATKASDDKCQGNQFGYIGHFLPDGCCAGLYLPPCSISKCLCSAFSLLPALRWRRRLPPLRNCMFLMTEKTPSAMNLWVRELGCSGSQNTKLLGSLHAGGMTALALKGSTSGRQASVAFLKLRGGCSALRMNSCKLSLMFQSLMFADGYFFLRLTMTSVILSLICVMLLRMVVLRSRPGMVP
mmetsp:Transcript_12109/g.26021  ORF Transcript_12109/g.26021 Transcript_12109/m.26021 type:complete len:202 (+) Transcript_12109:509-1114(+)